ncbi:MAG: hypothetical protein IT441_06880 [Phycisphaeraceae bacterium]|nr:hypothetical protein [Phycisphaeraceae bacterium]
MYRLTCPACGHVRSGPFVRVEAVVRCAKCGKVFTVTPDLVQRTVPPPTIGGPVGPAVITPSEPSAERPPAAPASSSPALLVQPPAQTPPSASNPTGSSILEVVRSVIPAHKSGSAGLRWREAIRSRAGLIGSAAAGAVVLLGLLMWALSGGEGSPPTQPADDQVPQAQGPVAKVSMLAVMLRAGEWQEAGDLLPASESSKLVVVDAMDWPGAKAVGDASSPAEQPGTASGDDQPTTLPGAIPGELAGVVVKVRNATDQVVVGSVLELVLWTPAPTSLAKAASRMDLPVLLARESLEVSVSIPEELSAAGSTLTGRLLGGEAWPRGVELEIGQVRAVGQTPGQVDHVVLGIEPAEGRAVQEVAFEVVARDREGEIVGRWGATGGLTREAGEAAGVDLMLPALVLRADDIRWQAVGVGQPAAEPVSKP